MANGDAQDEQRRQEREFGQRLRELEYQSKTESERLGFRGLAFINGGAAVALGTFLHALIGNDAARSYIGWVLAAIALNGIGVALAASSFVIAYMQWQREVDFREFRRRNRWWWLKWISAGASLLLFLASLAAIVAGGYRTLTAC